MAFVKGIDFHPSYQPVTDWVKLRAFLGYDGFAIVKATQGNDYRAPGAVDYFKKTPPSARGAYHFAQPGRGTAVQQADYYRDWLADAGWRPGFDLPPVLDFEVSSGWSNERLREFGLQFMQRIDQQLRLTDPWQKTMLYVNRSWRDRLGSTVYNGRVTWLAVWPDAYAGKWPTADSAKPAGAGIWQFDDGMNVPGISKKSDGDVALRSDLARMAPKHYGVKEENVPLTKADAQLVAREVIALQGVDLSSLGAEKLKELGYTRAMYSLGNTTADGSWQTREARQEIAELRQLVLDGNKALLAAIDNLGAEIPAELREVLESGVVKVDVEIRDRITSGGLAGDPAAGETLEQEPGEVQ